MERVRFHPAATWLGVAVVAVCSGQLATRAGFVEADPGIEFTRTFYNGAASWGDFDGDGHLDLFVTLVDGGVNIRRNVLYRNTGEGRFEVAGADRIGELAGDTGFSVQGIWADIDNDGDLDLYVVNRVDRGGTGGVPMLDNLFFNDGHGVFTRHPVDGTDAPSLRANSGSLADFDGDGHLDLFLADWGQSSGTPDVFFRNQGNLRFSRVLPLRSRSSLATSGAWADFDGDGDLDVVVANQEGVAFLFKNLLRETGKADFTAISAVADSLGIRFASTSGCIAWGDFNNDGRLDLLMSNDDSGFRIHFRREDGSYEAGRYFGPGMRMVALLDADNDGDLDIIADMTTGSGGYRLFRNDGDGTSFTNEALAPARQSSYVQSAPAVGDFNNDGYPDVFIVYPGLPGRLLVNEGGENRWLKLVLRGISSNGSGVGAVVRVKATIGGREVWQTRHVAAGGEAWRVQHDMRPNFGLGDATQVDLVRIDWPSGAVQELTDVAANQIVTVTEPPVLLIEPAIVLAWPIRAEGYVLTGSDAVSGPWQPVNASVEVKDGRSTVTVRARDRMRYYQLEHP